MKLLLLVHAIMLTIAACYIGRAFVYLIVMIVNS